MLKYLSLIGAIVVLTGTFSFMVASANIEEIKENWATKRCEIPIMITAGMFKPSFYTKSSTDFARENFEFCTRKLADQVIKIAFAPLFTIAKEQMNVQNTLAVPMNSVRGMIKKGVDSFKRYMQTQYLQYTATIVQLTKTTQHLKFAMGRVQGIVMALLYTIYSLITLVNNTVKFAMTAAWIFVGIMAALILLIWFGIIPFLIIIGPLIAILAVAAAQTDGWLSPFSDGFISSAFCIDPDAKVAMADGSQKSLRELKVGDKLYKKSDRSTDNTITGILVVNAKDEPLVSVYGIRMSTTHRVLYKSSWILAKDHPDAIVCNDKLETLICLNTTHHSVPIQTQERGTLYASDWEEIETWDAQRKWVDWVHMKLNGGFDKVHRYPTSVPLCGKKVQVVCAKRGWVDLEQIQLGDSILGESGWVEVKGLYSGRLDVVEIPKYPDWISDGVWIKANRYWLTRGNGVREASNDSTTSIQGLQLVTSDGTFMIRTASGLSLVRDFTEVGADQIAESYSWLDMAINKKRSS